MINAYLKFISERQIAWDSGDYALPKQFFDQAMEVDVAIIKECESRIAKLI